MLKGSRSMFWKIWAFWEDVGTECCACLWSVDTWADNSSCTWHTGHQRPYISLFCLTSTMLLRGWKRPPSPADFAETDCWRLLIHGLYDRKMPYFWIVLILKVMYKQFSLRWKNSCPVLIFWVAGECPKLHISHEVVLGSFHTLVKIVFVTRFYVSVTHIFYFPDGIGGIWLSHI